jgi:hypothetical protein
MESIVVLGMHRSGTSCLAGMLAAAGIASAGDTIRNWDNARGHHEMLDLVRLNEAVLAHSGGHWLSAPREVRWTAAHAAERDRLLRLQIDGRPVLLKDPRTLLVLPFWRASANAFRTVGIVRHPLAVARSLDAWRGMPLADGIALWLAHNRVLAAERAERGCPVIDFEQPRDAFVAAVGAVSGGDAAALGRGYEAQLVHHDPSDAPVVADLDQAIALYRELAGALTGSRSDLPAPRDPTPRVPFPRAQLSAVRAAVARADVDAALEAARHALAGVSDPAAALIPIVGALLYGRAIAEPRALAGARDLIDERARDLEPGLADLLHAKLDLAAGDPETAVTRLERACAQPQPLYQARGLLPQALRAAGDTAEARGALEQLSRDALYPHGPLSTLAEWSWLDGDRDRAITEMRTAIAAAPSHRRGRLRTRLAEWLHELGDPASARTELALAIDEDPGYARSREVLAQHLDARRR